MKIAGMQKVTLLDFPDTLSCIIFTKGCNFKCPFCQNSGLINNLDDDTLEMDKVFSYLEKRKGILEGVVITGGEPTIHKDLKEFIKKIKDMGYKVKLDTNGYNPVMLKDLIDSNLLDYVAMDIKQTLAKYSMVSGVNINTDKIMQSIKILEDSNVSHEFKTPINAIEGYTMLLQGEELSNEQNEYVEKILFNTQRLSCLVGNILLLSKLENQNIPMKKTKYRLDEQIRQALLSLESKWTQKEIGFQVEMEAVKYVGNEGLFMHVWINLLDNAIKFSPNQGIITMFLKQENDQVKFILEDEGPGIDEEIKNRIFDKFYQADGSHKAEGNGLGLALVKRIIDSAGGTIEAQNREYGGCSFVVQLPLQ